MGGNQAKQQARNKGKQPTIDLDGVPEEVSVQAYEKMSAATESFLEYTKTKADESCSRANTERMKWLKNYHKVLITDPLGNDEELN